MTSIPLEDLLTLLYVLVDDWYQAEGCRYLKGKVGAKPEFRDSEVMTLVIARDYLPFPSEGQFLAFLRSNYRALFPRLLERQPIQPACQRLAPVDRTVALFLAGGGGSGRLHLLPAGHQAHSSGGCQALQPP